MKTKIVITVLVVAFASAGLTYNIMKSSISNSSAVSASVEDKASEGSETEALKIAGLQIEPAAAGEGWESVTITGKVTVPPDRLVRISSRIDGKVVAARGTVGDYVHRGQVLAVISSVTLAEARANYRQARARLAAAQQNYDRELHIAKLGATSVRPVEEARSESLVSQGDLADAKSELAQAKSELTREESELVQCKARLERAKDLYADKIISKQDMESAEAEYKRDASAVAAANSRISQAEARINKATLKLEISKQYLSREEKIYKGRVLDMRALQAAKSDIVAAKVDLQAASDKIRVLGASPSGSGDTIPITSPIDGRIISRQTNVGEMASPADALFTVGNLSLVWVEGDVHEKDIAKIRKGQIAEIRVDAYPDKVFTGRIDSISDMLSPESRTAKIRCAVVNLDNRLRGEMFARVTLLIAKRGQTVLVAKEAILDDAGKKIVFTPCLDCPEDKKAGTSACGAFDKLDVTTGTIRQDKVEVLSGIKPGTLVVTTGAYQIKTALGSGKLQAGCADGH